MNKLNKPRAFAASPNSLMVQFGTEERECTNLTRSAIMVQTVVLVADGGKWHEIEVADLALDSVHLPSFKNYVEQHGILLSDLGILQEEPMTNHELKHDDFMSLQTAYPKHSYIDIQKLHRYENERGNPSSRAHLIKVLKAISQEYLHIDGWISATEERREQLLLSSETTLLESIVPERDAFDETAVDTTKPQIAIACDTVPVPVPVPVPADSVSLSLFEKLTPEKITELQGLRIQQEDIVKNNPVIVIKDKKTYAEAKKTAAILLSASTAIDGTKGMEATISKYLNTIKTTVKNALAPIAKLTRDPYDKQKKLIEDWDNRVLLMVQIRSKELNSVPFVYNSENDTYTIGSMVVTQKEIEELTDIDWSKKIEQGRAIVIALEAVKTEQDARINALEEQNKLLQEQIKAFMALQNPSVTAQEAVIDMVTNPVSCDLPKTDIPNQEQFTNKFAITTGTHNAESPFSPQNSTQDAQTTEEQLKLPNPNNKLLNAFYMRNLEIVESERFQEDASLFAQVLSFAGHSIQDILENPDKTVQKSVAITELIKTWKL